MSKSDNNTTELIKLEINIDWPKRRTGSWV